jgi:hypothetical protein
MPVYPGALGVQIFSAKNQILEAIQVVQNMRHSPLADLREKIEFYHGKVAEFDYSTLETETVSAQRARDMAPSKPDTTVPQSGMFMPDGKIHLIPPAADAARINSLSDRLSKLEK